MAIEPTDYYMDNSTRFFMAQHECNGTRYKQRFFMALSDYAEHVLSGMEAAAAWPLAWHAWYHDLTKDEQDQMYDLQSILRESRWVDVNWQDLKTWETITVRLEWLSDAPLPTILEVERKKLPPTFTVG